MSSEKRFILSVDQDKIVFPKELLPNEVEQYLCNVHSDGRMVLTPINASVQLESEKTDDPGLLQSEEGFENVIDFKNARRRYQKSDLNKGKKPRLPRKDADQEEPFSFVTLHLFSSRLEAEMVGEILRQAEIPYLIQSEDIGIFGPGASPVPGGVRMVVRESDLEYAKGLLAGLI